MVGLPSNVLSNPSIEETPDVSLLFGSMTYFGPMTSLEQVRSALVAKLGSEDMLALVNVRLILRTGVNLSTIDPRYANDAGRISKVLSALREMGLDVSQQEMKGANGK